MFRCVSAVSVCFSVFRPESTFRPDYFFGFFFPLLLVFSAPSSSSSFFFPPISLLLLPSSRFFPPRALCHFFFYCFLSFCLLLNGLIGSRNMIKIFNTQWRAVIVVLFCHFTFFFFGFNFYVPIKCQLITSHLNLKFFNYSIFYPFILYT